MTNFIEGSRRKDLLVTLNLDPLHARGFGKKFLDFKKHALSRGKQVTLTFDQYIFMVVEAGLTEPSQIGNRMGQYQVGRHLDQGDYHAGNCRFISKEQNLNELRYYRYGKGDITNVV